MLTRRPALVPGMLDPNRERMYRDVQGDLVHSLCVLHVRGSGWMSVPSSRPTYLREVTKGIRPFDSTAQESKNHTNDWHGLRIVRI